MEAAAAHGASPRRKHARLGPDVAPGRRHQSIRGGGDSLGDDADLPGSPASRRRDSSRPLPYGLSRHAQLFRWRALDGDRVRLSALGRTARSASTGEGAQPAQRTSAVAPSTFRARRSWPAWRSLRGTWSRVPDAWRQCQAIVVRRFRHHAAHRAALRFATDGLGTRARFSSRAPKTGARSLCPQSAWRPSAFSARFRWFSTAPISRRKAPAHG